MTDVRIITELRTSPHLKQAVTVPQIMRNVVYALLPVCAWSVYAFGISVLLLLATTTPVSTRSAGSSTTPPLRPTRR